MIAHLVAGIKRGFGLHRPGRNLLILPDDIFLVSFPKSGNTWARFLLANLTRPEQPVTFANLHLLIPDPLDTNKRDFDRVPRPRMIKSHECFDPRYPRVIYFVRDPRDVAVSQYHYQRKREKIADDASMDAFVDRFLAGQTCQYGSWGEHMVTWLSTRKNDSRFLLLRYEDMVTNTARELRRIAKFLKVPADAARITHAVEQSNAGRMRKLEQAQSEQSDLTKGTRKDLNFVRAAGSGGWRSALSPSAVAKIETAWGPLMRYLRYELSSQPPTEAPPFEPLGMMNVTTR